MTSAEDVVVMAGAPLIFSGEPVSLIASTITIEDGGLIIVSVNATITVTELTGTGQATVQVQAPATLLLNADVIVGTVTINAAEGAAAVVTYVDLEQGTVHGTGDGNVEVRQNPEATAPRRSHTRSHPRSRR
jgi:hypothetical protein